ncbi:MAG: YajQ family cyclic di-GMP-binding protein [Elusimicrobia bacterium]|nr:YajQ family cyclic di-GMP-binding protein [Elusimicrobiota bacterium]
MAQEFSFDVVSKVDFQAVDDAVNMAMKEITNRFDFKGSVSRIDFDRKEGNLTILSDDENRLAVVIDILKTRLFKRGVSLKNLELGAMEPAEAAAIRQKAKILQGIPQDKAKTIVAAIKSAGRKVTPSIQGDYLRISSKSKDDLQGTMALLKSQNYGLDLQFVNYR